MVYEDYTLIVLPMFRSLLVYGGFVRNFRSFYGKFMRILMIFALCGAFFGCTTTYNTKIDSDNTIIVEKSQPVVYIRDPHNPYKKN